MSAGSYLTEAKMEFFSVGFIVFFMVSPEWSVRWAWSHTRNRTHLEFSTPDCNLSWDRILHAPVVHLYPDGMPMRSTNAEYPLNSKRLDSNQAFHFLSLIWWKGNRSFQDRLDCWDAMSWPGESPAFRQDKVTRDAACRELSLWMSRRQAARPKTLSQAHLQRGGWKSCFSITLN